MNNNKSIILSTCLFLLISITLSGQTYKIDSLRSLIKEHTVTDTSKVNYLNSLGFELYNRNASEALTLAQESMQIASALGYHKGKANSMWVSGLAHMRNNKDEALDKFTEALKIAEVIDYKEGICNYLTAIGNMSSAKGKPEESEQAYIRALGVAESIGDLSLIQKCRINVARKKMSAGKYPEAAQSLHEVINTARQMNDTLLLARACSNLATVNMRQGSTAMGLKYYFQSLRYNEKMNDPSGTILSLINIASAQAQHKDRESAIETINKALTMAEQVEDSTRISLCYTVMGNLYSRTDMQKALHYLHKVESMKHSYSTVQQVTNLVNIGSIYIDLKELDKAEVYLFDALDLARRIEIKTSIASVYEKLSVLFLAKGNYAQAIVYAQKTIALAAEIGRSNLLARGYKLMSDIFVAKGDYKQAFTYLTTHKELSDSIYHENDVRKVAMLESEYVFSKERDELKQKQTEIQIIANNQKQTIRYLVVISLLVLLIAIILFRWGRLKKRVLSLELENISQELDTNRKDIAVAQLKLAQNSERDAHTVKVLEGIANTAQGVDKYSLKSLIGDYKLDGAYTNWEEFEAIFNQVDTAFCQNLNRQYPTLTPNERRLCIFMKLNMSNKEISQITFQTEDALKKSRMRLRRKLGIERSVNLAAFIQSL